jgi:hypothetical protein
MLCLSGFSAAEELKPKEAVKLNEVLLVTTSLFYIVTTHLYHLVHAIKSLCAGEDIVRNKLKSLKWLDITRNVATATNFMATYWLLKDTDLSTMKKTTAFKAILVTMATACTCVLAAPHAKAIVKLLLKVVAAGKQQDQFKPRRRRVRVQKATMFSAIFMLVYFMPLVLAGVPKPTMKPPVILESKQEEVPDTSAHDCPLVPRGNHLRSTWVLHCGQTGANVVAANHHLWPRNPRT